MSYAHADVAEARRIAEALSSLGWSVWWDPSLCAGEIWSERLEEELNAARSIVVLWSDSSSQSAWVKREAEAGLERRCLVPVTRQAAINPPDKFSHVQADSLAKWDYTPQHAEFKKLVSDLTVHLGEPPRGWWTPFARHALETKRPSSARDLAIPRMGLYFASPADWKGEILYLLIPDRFSDGREDERPLMDHASVAADSGAVPASSWAASGEGRWQGGILAGVASKLDYLKTLGVTTVWLWPVWKQRACADTFHGYAIQDFLDVDPRLGTRETLVDLVAAAHFRGMRVILSGEIHHSGTNWLYSTPAGVNPREVPYTSGRHPFGTWLGADDQPIATPENPDDAVWPIELQDPACYMRAGVGRLDPELMDTDRPDVEFRRSDFFSLRTFDPDRALDALIACHKYWLALTDCDGFFLDCLAQERREILNAFCRSIRDYATRLGKENFLLIGEVFGTRENVEAQYQLIGRTLRGTVSAVLDNGPMRVTLQSVAKGIAPASEWFSGYVEGGEDLTGARALGDRHVSVLDDPDNVFGWPKLRSSARVLQENQVTVAMALQLFSLGIPSIYYGTEQALGGIPPHADPAQLPSWGEADFFLREAMFGPEHPRKAGRPGLAPAPTGLDLTLPGFGPFGTSGRHAFDQSSPTFLKIAALAAVRQHHKALRQGTQFQREISVDRGPFAFPAAGEVIAWSRILDDEEFVCLANPSTMLKSARVIIDSSLNREGGVMSVILSTASVPPRGAPDRYAKGVRVPVLRDGGAAFVEIRGLPPAEVVVLSNERQV